jgi:fructose-1,6-bisphosphatase/inositol monophosphatase family enzyme
MKATEVFRFKDHVGGIVHNTEAKTLHGVNWGSRRFYRFTLDDQGRVTNASVPPAELRRMNKSGYIDYQDCKYLGGNEMLCSGLNNYQMKKDGPRFPLGGFEIVDLRTDQAIAQMPIELWTESGFPMTQNPVLDRIHRDGFARVLHAGRQQVHVVRLRSGREVTDRFDLCRALARDAGKLAHRGFGTSSTKMKGVHDVVTEMDGAVERYITRADREALSEDAVLGEEEGGATGDRLWIIDPIDGTANYARGLPRYCVSIGYLERGVPTLGAIYDPSHDWLYAAARGEGAWQRRRAHARERSTTCTRPRSSAVVHAAPGVGVRRLDRPRARGRRLRSAARARAPRARRRGRRARRGLRRAAHQLVGLRRPASCWSGGGRLHQRFFAGDGMRSGNPLLATNAALCGKLADVIGIPYKSTAGGGVMRVLNLVRRSCRRSRWPRRCRHGARRARRVLHGAGGVVPPDGAGVREGHRHQGLDDAQELGRVLRAAQGRRPPTQGRHLVGWHGRPAPAGRGRGLTERTSRRRWASSRTGPSAVGASKGRTVGVYAGALGYSYNTEQLKKKNIPAPKCWADLTKPAFKDEIQVANPNSSARRTRCSRRSCSSWARTRRSST